MPKTKMVRKDAYMRLSKANDFCTEPQKGVLLLYFDSFSLPNAKRSEIKTFLKKSLVSLTFRLRTVFYFLFLKNDSNFDMLVHHEKMGSL